MGEKYNVSNPKEAVSTMSTFTTQLSANAKSKKLSDKTISAVEGIDVITNYLAIPAGVLLASATQNPQNFANGVVLMKGGGAAFRALYSTGEKVTKGKYRASDAPGFRDLYTEAARVANEEKAYNRSASLTVGRQSTNEVMQSASVQLEGGYAVDVAMRPGENRPYKRFLGIDNKAETRLFNVDDQSDFRKVNAHISGNKEKRAEYLKAKKIDPASDLFETTNGEDYRQLIQQLGDGTDPDVYLDLTGAPYHYNEDDDKLYPSTVRYSGDSLKELMAIATNSAKVSNLGTGHNHTIDMVDLTYAHGKHAHEVRKRGTTLTRPVYQLDEKHPELFSEPNHKRNLTEWIKNTASGMKRGLKQLKEKGGEVYRRVMPQFNQAEQNLDDVLNVVTQTDGVAPKQRPVTKESTNPSVPSDIGSAYNTEVDPTEMERYETPIEPVDGATKSPIQNVVPKRHVPTLTPEETELRKAVALNDQYSALSLQQALMNKVAASGKQSNSVVPD